MGADTFVEIELWAREKLDWLRGHLRLAHGIPSHDTFGRMFGLIDAEQFEGAFRRWVGSVLPALGAEIVAIDGKISRRSGGVDATALHLVSAFAAGAGLVLGQRATADRQQPGHEHRFSYRLLRLAWSSAPVCWNVAQSTEPPYADPHVRWCGRRGEERRGEETLPPMPIMCDETAASLSR